MRRMFLVFKDLSHLFLAYPRNFPYGVTSFRGVILYLHYFVLHFGFFFVLGVIPILMSVIPIEDYINPLFQIAIDILSSDCYYIILA